MTERQRAAASQAPQQLLELPMGSKKRKPEITDLRKMENARKLKILKDQEAEAIKVGIFPAWPADLLIKHTSHLKIYPRMQPFTGC